MMEIGKMVAQGEETNHGDDWDKEGTKFIPFGSREEDAEDEPYVDGPLARSEFDLPEGPLLRFQAYRKAWDKCLERIKEVVHKLQQHVVDNIIHTVQNAYVDSPEDIALPASELVTILVSNFDRRYVHECLAYVVTTLREEVDNTSSRDESEVEDIPGALISRISESDCQNVNSLVKALILGFISQPLGFKVAKKMKPSLSLANHDMYILRAWYQAVQAHYGSNVPSLIVIIQDLHHIDPINLRDLFELCSCHVSHVPLLFLLGTSEPNHLHSVLPRSTIACLRLEKYILPWDVKTLEHVIRETFFSLNFVPNLMVGPGGFEMIFKEFKRHNSTMDALMSTLQLLHMQHFYNPLAFMVDVDYDVVLYNILDRSREEWKSFFQLLRQHRISVLMATGSTQEQPEWLNFTPQEIVRNVLEARTTFHNRMIEMKLAIHVLDIIVKFARGHGLKTMDMSFESLGLEALRGTLSQDSARSACDLMRQLKPTEANALLEELFHFMHNLPSTARVIESKLKHQLVIAKNEMDTEKLAVFLDFLTVHFEQTLAPFDDIACLDVWWTGEISIPNSPLNPSPHLSIVTSLLEPQEFLGWTGSAKLESRRKLASLPDISIVFQRYAESGKMINVYDWYESFSVALEDLGFDGSKEIMEVDETPSKRRTKGKEKVTRNRREQDNGQKRDENEQQQEIQARFMRAMHELEFVGFLKRTGRKADHVLKTVFDAID